MAQGLGSEVLAGLCCECVEVMEREAVREGAESGMGRDRANLTMEMNRMHKKIIQEAAGAGTCIYMYTH